MSEPQGPSDFEALSIDEKIDLVQSLWQRIAAKPEALPVPEWHRQILRTRVLEYRAAPAAGDSWSEVRRRLEEKLRKPHQ